MNSAFFSWKMLKNVIQLNQNSRFVIYEYLKINTDHAIFVCTCCKTLLNALKCTRLFLKECKLAFNKIFQSDHNYWLIRFRFSIGSGWRHSASSSSISSICTMSAVTRWFNALNEAIWNTWNLYYYLTVHVFGKLTYSLNAEIIGSWNTWFATICNEQKPNY